MVETRWLYRTSGDFAELRDESRGVCVIPMGCVEKHGLHLAVGTDILLASNIAYRASQLETCCIFPDFTFGDLPNNFPIAPEGSMSEGNITLTLETEMLLLDELCAQISRNGYKKILVCNGHGGNSSWLNAYMRKLGNKKRDFVMAVFDIGLMVPHNFARLIRDNGSGYFPELTKEDEALLLRQHAEGMLAGHAGMGEVSLMMGIDPSTYHPEMLGIESGAPTGRSGLYKKHGLKLADGGWDIDVPNAFYGDDPYGVNERIGRAAVRFEVERLAKAIKFFKEDEYLLSHLEKSQKGW